MLVISDVVNYRRDEEYINALRMADEGDIGPLIEYIEMLVQS